MYCECNVETPNYSEYGVAKANVFPWISKKKDRKYEKILQTFYFLVRLIEKQ